VDNWCRRDTKSTSKQNTVLLLLLPSGNVLIVVSTAWWSLTVTLLYACLPVLTLQVSVVLGCPEGFVVVVIV